MNPARKARRTRKLSRSDSSIWSKILLQTFKPAKRIIEGKVTDTSGKPVSGARVIPRADDQRIRPNGVIVLTGPDGRYR